MTVLFQQDFPLPDHLVLFLALCPLESILKSISIVSQMSRGNPINTKLDSSTLRGLVQEKT